MPLWMCHTNTSNWHYVLGALHLCAISIRINIVACLGECVCDFVAAIVGSFVPTSNLSSSVPNQNRHIRKKTNASKGTTTKTRVFESCSSDRLICNFYLTIPSISRGPSVRKGRPGVLRTEKTFRVQEISSSGECEEHREAPSLRSATSAKSYATHEKRCFFVLTSPPRVPERERVCVVCVQYCGTSSYTTQAQPYGRRERVPQAPIWRGRGNCICLCVCWLGGDVFNIFSQSWALNLLVRH